MGTKWPGPEAVGHCPARYLPVGPVSQALGTRPPPSQPERTDQDLTPPASVGIWTKETSPPTALPRALTPGDRGPQTLATWADTRDRANPLSMPLRFSCVSLES